MPLITPTVTSAPRTTMVTLDTPNANISVSAAQVRGMYGTFQSANIAVAVSANTAGPMTVDMQTNGEAVKIIY